MPAPKPTRFQLAVAACLAALAAIAFGGLELAGGGSPARAADAEPAPAARAVWAASATGRVEPKSGQILVGTLTPGRVAEVAVRMNAEVKAGDLLVRLEDDDLVTRLSAASAEAQVRVRERNEEVAKGPAAERRDAEDAAADAERAVFRARMQFDDTALKLRGGAATVTAADLDRARFEINKAKDQLATSRAELARVAAKDGMPLVTRGESSLAATRSDLSLAEASVEHARIRAPIDGTVLSVLAKVGELVAPSPDAPVVVMGDLSGLRVKAEVDERDVTRVKVGQRVVVKGDAYADRAFDGVVSEIAQSMATPRIATRGVRRPNDVDVVEVTVLLDGKPPLIPGMRVDVFFKNDGKSDAKAPSGSAEAAAAAPGTKTN